MSALELGWAAGLFVGLLVLPVVAVLLHRVLRPLREAKHYADDVVAAATAADRNLAGVAEAEQTRRLAGALPGPAESHASRRRFR